MSTRRLDDSGQNSPPGPSLHPLPAEQATPHQGVKVLGVRGDEGRKAFYIHIEAPPGKEDAVVKMLRDIRACVEDEPATGPWFAVRFFAKDVRHLRGLSRSGWAAGPR